MLKMQILGTLLKIKPIFIDSNISGPLIGALIASLSAWVLANASENYKFNKKKKGAYVIINSEFENNIFNLKVFKIYHPLINHWDLHDKGRIKDIDEFYRSLNDFPSLKHDNWDKFIDIIPDIFHELEINRLIEFNTMLDKLTYQATILSKNPPKFDEKEKYNKLNEKRFEYYMEISKDYQNFEKNFTETLKKSDYIQEILKDKRFKL